MAMREPEALVNVTPWSGIEAPKAPALRAVRIVGREIADGAAPVSYNAVHPAEPLPKAIFT
jgi:hypothetical protein